MGVKFDIFFTNKLVLKAIASYDRRLRKKYSPVYLRKQNSVWKIQIYNKNNLGYSEFMICFEWIYSPKWISYNGIFYHFVLDLES